MTCRGVDIATWTTQGNTHRFSGHHARGIHHKSTAKSNRLQAFSNLDDGLFMGIDFGTSGGRVSIVDFNGEQLAAQKVLYPPMKKDERTRIWQQTLLKLLDSVSMELKSRLKALAIDGTSGTAFLLDANDGSIITAPKMYNESESKEIVDMVRSIAPESHTTIAASSTLCKLLGWYVDGTWQGAVAAGRSPVLVHQADWLAYLLHGRIGISDWNNALKLGFDPELEAWPQWLLDTEIAEGGALPSTVLAPGKPIACISHEAAAMTGISEDCIVCSGTTDSIAAFLAAGVNEPGQAVTSLGSTLAIKLLSEKRVDEPNYGIYSHRIGDSWLVGGASNSGGAVLRQFFDDEQLAALSKRMDPTHLTGFHYTVLPRKGERFPIDDPNLEPYLEPRPQDDALFLQGMLESISRVEAEAFDLLAKLGASKLKEVVTCGGGANNEVWTEIRRQLLGVPVSAAKNGEASYGTALLALRSVSSW